MKNIFKSNRAFTLVELLVVIAIIAILTGIIVTNLVSSRSKARDGKRISDLGQIQLAINLYYDRCRAYPSSTGQGGILTGAVDISSNCGAGKLTDYISQIPVPPGNAPLNQTQYDYTTDANKDNYVLHTVLENQNEVTADSLQGPNGSGPLGTICFDPNSTSPSPDYCIGPK